MTSTLHAQGRPDRTLGLEASAPIPLVVDLDGTLLRSDSLVESLFLLAKQKPLLCLRLPFWLASGRAHCKRRLAQEVVPDVHTLPYRQELRAYLEAEKRNGRSLVLATGADAAVAQAVAQEVGLFDRVFASDGTMNLSGDAKRDRLVAEYGAGGFDYIGAGADDRSVWRVARNAIAVGTASMSHARATRDLEVSRAFPETPPALGTYLHVLRAHHWFKNLLVFLPLLAAHRFVTTGSLIHAVFAFVAISLCASSVYLLNDLMDLPEDRRHPHKRDRVLASGQFPIAWAMLLMPLLWLAGFSLSLVQPPLFAVTLAAYSALMLAYCSRLRDLFLIDTVALAAGYTLRVLLGAAAASLTVSPWLLGCCILFFFGLALLKRYAELVILREHLDHDGHIRAYHVTDSSLVAACGIASCYLAVAVLAGSTLIDRPLFEPHAVVWVVCALLGCWVTHMWWMARRGRITNDPVSFALGDPASRVLGFLTVTTMLWAI